MIDQFLQLVTGKDDLERVAEKGDPEMLRAYLEERELWIPARPLHFYEAADCTQEEFTEALESRCFRPEEEVGEAGDEAAGRPFEPWILMKDGRKCLPAFSSREKLQAFSEAMAQRVQKVFPLPSVEAILPEVAAAHQIEVVDLNPFSVLSWEIELASTEEDESSFGRKSA